MYFDRYDPSELEAIIKTKQKVTDYLNKKT